MFSMLTKKGQGEDGFQDLTRNWNQSHLRNHDVQKNDIEGELYIPLRSMLRSAIQKGQEAVKLLVPRVEIFSRGGSENEVAVEDCIRWIVLSKAVEATDLDLDISSTAFSDVPIANVTIESEPDEAVMLSLIILSISPHLAFAYPSSLAKLYPPSLADRSCKFEQKHQRLGRLFGFSNPFHTAAAQGNGKMLQRMIKAQEMQKADQSNMSQHERILDILRQEDPSRRGFPQTALSLAATVARGNLDALQALLDFDVAIALPSDGTFEYALEGGHINILKAFLDREALRKTFITAESMLTAMKNLQREYLQDNEHEDMREILNILVRHGTGDAFNDGVVEKMIELNLKDMWVEKRSEIKSDYLGLLHLAVRHQNLEFVEIFLNDYPESVEVQRSGGYPLWHHRESESRSQCLDSDDFLKRKRIRNALVNMTVKRVKKMQTLSSIFHDCGEFGTELCFDLSRFNSKAYRFSDFVRSLINHTENEKVLSFEKTLKYVELPALDLRADDREIFGDSVHSRHTEAFDVLKWLGKRKGVDEIIELIVADRLVNPHNETEIAKYVREFKVESLDWKFLDMSLSIFEDQDTRNRIKELHLYSSGKLAPISHWFSNEGIASLPSLENVEIHVIQELMTKKDCKKTVEFIRSKFSEFKRASQRRGLKVSVTTRLWNPTHERLADLEEIAEKAVPKLSRFIKSYHAFVQLRSAKKRPSKVAIIDNGILSFSPSAVRHWETTIARHKRNGFDTSSGSGSPTGSSETEDEPVDWDHSQHQTLWSRIKGGQSFVDDDFRGSPWLFASDPHGTQMANLICAIDPHCDLYVAKVTDTRSGINPTRVAKAVRWATSVGVDIISMSFAMLDSTRALEVALDEARMKGIVMFCSTHDEGVNVPRAWPASSQSTLTVTACDEITGLPLIPNNEFQYGIPASEVAAGVVPFLESHDHISGSSVATAIAAGLSSLVLACHRLAHYEETSQEDHDKHEVVTHHLSKMESSQQKRFLLLGSFAGIDAKMKDGLDISAEQIINEVFMGVKIR